MYEPFYNTVLVQIDDKDAKWGSGNDDSMLGKSYSKGTVIRVSTEFVATQAYPQQLNPGAQITLSHLEGKQVSWNEGAEAGTVFDFDGKVFGLIYWWDIRGVSVEASK